MSVAKKKKLKDITEEEDGEDNVGKWFLQFTSVGGLSQFGQSKFILSKIAWLLLLIFGIIITIYQCVDLYHEYYEYEVREEILFILAVTNVHRKCSSKSGGDTSGSSECTP